MNNSCALEFLTLLLYLPLIIVIARLIADSVVECASLQQRTRTKFYNGLAALLTARRIVNERVPTI